MQSSSYIGDIYNLNKVILLAHLLNTYSQYSRNIGKMPTPQNYNIQINENCSILGQDILANTVLILENTLTKVN